MRSIEIVALADLRPGDTVILFDTPETRETLQSVLGRAQEPDYFIEDVWEGPDVEYGGAVAPLGPFAFRVTETDES